MSEKNGEFKSLGRQLRALRIRAKESLAEASGAVEIDVKQLASFELGQSRPSEDVLLLLISHFGAQDEEAVKIWEMAGYGSPQNTSQQTGPAATPILFTDVVDIMVNNYGVVMNFMQSTGSNLAPASVSRVGMSREHAKSLLQILKVTLEQTDQKNQRISSPGKQTD